MNKRRSRLLIAAIVACLSGLAWAIPPLFTIPLAIGLQVITLMGTGAFCEISECGSTSQITSADKVLSVVIKPSDNSPAVRIPVGETQLASEAVEAPWAPSPIPAEGERYFTVDGFPGIYTRLTDAFSIFEGTWPYGASCHPTRYYGSVGTTSETCRAYNSQTQGTLPECPSSGKFILACNMGGVYSGVMMEATWRYGPSECAPGYEFDHQNRNCKIKEPRKTTNDGNVDFKREGTTFTEAEDADTSNVSRVVTQTVYPNDTVMVSGYDGNGGQIRVATQALQSGGTLVSIARSVYDSESGAERIERRMYMIDAANGVTSASQYSGAGSMQQGTNNMWYVTGEGTGGSSGSGGSTGSGGTGTGNAQVQFPSDYARAGEAGQAASGVIGAINGLKSDLLTPSQAPADPGNPEWSFFDGTFAGIVGWSVPPHMSQCPTGAFDAFGYTYAIDVHCSLVADHWSALSAAMAVVWTLVALFIVLGA